MRDTGYLHYHKIISDNPSGQAGLAGAPVEISREASICRGDSSIGISENSF